MIQTRAGTITNKQNLNQKAKVKLVVRKEVKEVKVTFLILVEKEKEKVKEKEAVKEKELEAKEVKKARREKREEHD